MVKEFKFPSPEERDYPSMDDMVTNEERAAFGINVERFMDYLYDLKKPDGDDFESEEFKKQKAQFESMGNSELLRLFNGSGQRDWHRDPTFYKALNRELNQRAKKQSNQKKK